MSDNRGFQVYALDNPQGVRTIRANLERIKVELIEQLISAQDWSDHRLRVGEIRGLDRALHVCDEVEQAERA